MRGCGSQMAGKPNIVVLITDQQRRPRHWPDEPGWLEIWLRMFVERTMTSADELPAEEAMTA